MEKSCQATNGLADPFNGTEQGTSSLPQRELVPLTLINIIYWQHATDRKAVHTWTA
jgi:hypothetical protein